MCCWNAGILAVGYGQSEPRELWQPAALSAAEKKAKKKKKALKHKSPLGREEMSKDAAVTQAHSHMPEDDARKRQSLCVHKHMLSLSCVHCSQMIWKNTLQRHIVQSAIYPENKTKCKIGQAVKVFYCISYKCCRTFNPYKYYAENLPIKIRNISATHPGTAWGFLKVILSIFLTSIPAELQISPA